MTEVINKTLRPNSIQFRYGGTGTDCKIYFEDSKDLEQQLEALNKSMDNVKSLIQSIKKKFEDNS